ncbi:hypothetical protein MVEN_02012600 [Mycena venus]|uniref:Uncharacterized protein n=1 Tax=Mycena venus TaxID=2733690 RepID=A0A8H6XCE1_9AGAR|nr:hypothetical protein MVEN_02012600 [Mycena venus]
MSTACITSATATTTSLHTTDVVSTSFSTSVSTEPATTTTITTEVCPLSISDLPCIPTPSVFTSTITGNLTTVSLPFTTTVSTVSTEILTLFTTSCTVITSAGPSSSSSSSFHTPPVSGSFSPSVSTPPPITFTSQVPTTLQNGDVSAVVQTFTSQPPLSTVYVPGPSGQVAQTNDDGSSPTKIAPILGGVVGGFFGLLGIALIIWFIMKRRRRWDDIFDTEGPPHSPGRRPTKRWSLDADMDPKPYQYGLVGQASSPSLPSLGISRPESPPASSPSSQLRASPSSQLPRPNHNALTPLLLPTSASTPGPSATTLSSRPSTAGSMQPLRDVAPQQPQAVRQQRQQHERAAARHARDAIALGAPQPEPKHGPDADAF